MNWFIIKNTINNLWKKYTQIWFKKGYKWHKKYWNLLKLKFIEKITWESSQGVTLFIIITKKCSSSWLKHKELVKGVLDISVFLIRILKSPRVLTSNWGSLVEWLVNFRYQFYSLLYSLFRFYFLWPGI